MQLAQLELRDFRNYERLSLSLPAGVAVLHGQNGSGKTNLLEAVCVATSGDSPRARAAEEMVRGGAEHAFIRAHLAAGGRNTRIEIGLARTGHRQLKIDGVGRRREALIGLAPTVLFWAEDIDMVRGEPAGRRRLVDRELSLINGIYAHHLTRYRRALEQRNRLLKQIKEGREGASTLGPWDRALARHGAMAMVERRAFVRALAPEAAEAHSVLAGPDRPLTVEYCPSVDTGTEQEAAAREEDREALAEVTATRLLEALEGRRQVDVAAGITTCGPHRDDIRLLLGGMAVRAFGSQGEQRTCAIAIRMGLAAVARAMTGEAPLVLLDDVLSELDQRHREGVFAACRQSDQVIITCCDYEDIPIEVRASATCFEVMMGTVHAR